MHTSDRVVISSIMQKPEATVIFVWLEAFMTLDPMRQKCKRWQLHCVIDYTENVWATFTDLS